MKNNKKLKEKIKIAPAFKCETITTTITTNSSDTTFYSNYRNQNVYTSGSDLKKKKTQKHVYKTLNIKLFLFFFLMCLIKYRATIYYFQSKSFT